MSVFKEKFTISDLLRWGLELLAMIILYFVLHSSGMKKYFILMVTSAVLFLFGRKKKWPIEVIICVTLPVFTYILLGGFSTLLNANPQMTSVKDLLFWIVPVVFACALYVFFGNDIKRIIDFQFIGSCVTYLYSYRLWLQWYGKAEDSFAFVFGAFAIYYVYKKRWIFVPIATLLMYFADKKIAFLAVVSVATIIVLLWLFKKSKILVMTIWNLGISGIFYYVYVIHSGVLKHICFNMGILGNGRMTMYDRFQVMYDFSPIFFGNGLGNVANILECWAIPTYNHLHNDLLKFYMELGFFGLLIFLASYIVAFHIAELKFGKSQMCGLLSMAIYSMILCMTDNVSVYILYLVPVYCICISLIVSEDKKQVDLHER